MTPPDDAALLPSTRAHIARYEVRAVRLEGTLSDYRRRQPLYRRFFLGLLIFGFACFGLGRLPGLWATVSAIVISGGGSVMLLGRLWEVQADVTATRAEIAHLRGGPSSARARVR